jgi:hypothetical protein
LAADQHSACRSGRPLDRDADRPSRTPRSGVAAKARRLRLRYRRKTAPTVEYQASSTGKSLILAVL